MASDADYVRRAMAAWFRTGGTSQPGEGSGIYEAQGRRYVELFTVSGTLAVYRIENGGRLKRLRRWPEPDRDAPMGPIGAPCAPCIAPAVRMGMP